MFTLDDKPETIHVYVVREEASKPQPFPIFLSALALLVLVVLSVAIRNPQPVMRLTLRVPAVLLPLKIFTATTAIIPTGMKVYPATTAYGTLTITNGSVIAQTIPQGFRLGNVLIDSSVFVPAGSANAYGYATVRAHAVISGVAGNIPALAINQVEGSSVYIRNLSAFSGGRDSYSLRVVTLQDRQWAIEKVQRIIAAQINGWHYPCIESMSERKGTMTESWRCQFVTYHIPTFYHVTGTRMIGKNLLLNVWFVARPTHIWVK